MTPDQIREKTATLTNQIALLQKELEQIQAACAHRKNEMDDEFCSVCGFIFSQDCE